jgi:hypothetical protein
MTDHDPLTDETEHLFRQIHPKPPFIQDGRVSSVAFRPTEKDQGRLSVARSSKTTAEDSYRTYVAQGFTSAGVMAVSVHECHSIDLTAYDDPLPNNPAHAFIDFSKCSSKKECEKNAKILSERARKRGFLFQA